MSSLGWMSSCRRLFSSHTILFETLVDNIKNWFYKVKQSLKNEKDNSYEKFITKCNRSLLQSVSILKSVTLLTRRDVTPASG